MALKAVGIVHGFPVPHRYVDSIIQVNLNTIMNEIFGEDEQRHNHKGGIELLTEGVITRIDQVEQAFVMALTKYRKKVWR